MFNLVTNKGRKLLKLIIEACDNQPATIDYQYLMDHVAYGKMTERDIQLNLTDLHLEKLIYFRVIPHHNVPLDITLKYDGLRYFDWKHERRMEFLKKNIFTPIVVSFFTTIGTLLIKSFF